MQLQGVAARSARRSSPGPYADVVRRRPGARRQPGLREPQAVVRGLQRVHHDAPGRAGHERLQRAEQDGGRRRSPRSCRSSTPSSPPSDGRRAGPERRPPMTALRRRAAPGPAPRRRGGPGRRRGPLGVAVPRPDARRPGDPVRRADPGHVRDQPDEVGPADGRRSGSGSTTTPRSSRDQRFQVALRNTTFYTVVSVPLGMVLALGLALALNQGIRGIAWIRTAYFLPVVTSATAVGLVWAWIYAPSGGILNQLIGIFGLPPAEVDQRPVLGDAGDRADERLAGPGDERDHLPGRPPGDPAGVLRRGRRGRGRALGALPAA